MQVVGWKKTRYVSCYRPCCLFTVVRVRLTSGTENGGRGENLGTPAREVHHDQRSFMVLRCLAVIEEKVNPPIQYTVFFERNTLELFRKQRSAPGNYKGNRISFIIDTFLQHHLPNPTTSLFYPHTTHFPFSSQCDQNPNCSQCLLHYSWPRRFGRCLPSPADIEHGHLYTIMVDDSGKELWEKLDVNVTGSPLPSYSAKFLERRQSLPSGSFTESSVNRIKDSDLFPSDGAFDRFVSGCNALGSGHLAVGPRAFSTPFGTVVAFMCNYSSKGKAVQLAGIYHLDSKC